MDKQHGTVEEQRARIAADGRADATDECGEENYGPMFRYVL